jgi:hypothetical protein
MQDFQSLKDKKNILKSTLSANVVGYEADIFSREDKVNNKVKKCATFDEGMLCCIKVGTHSSLRSGSWKKKKVESYCKYEELY